MECEAKATAIEAATATAPTAPTTTTNGLYRRSGKTQANNVRRAENDNTLNAELSIAKLFVAAIKMIANNGRILSSLVTQC